MAAWPPATESTSKKRSDANSADKDPDPRRAAPPPHAEAATTAVAVSPVARPPNARSVAPWPVVAGGTTAGDVKAHTPLHLGVLADLVRVLLGVLSGIDPLRLQVLG